MKRYRRLLASSVLGVGIMILIGLTSLATTQQEIFPFYSWFLFATVPNGKTTYQVLLHRIGGIDLAVPRPYNQSPEVIGNSHSIVDYKIIQRLGRACKEGKSAEIEKQRVLLEVHFPANTRYEVVRVRTDPIEQWRTRTVTIRESLHFFDVPPAPASSPSAIPPTVSSNAARS